MTKQLTRVPSKYFTSAVEDLRSRVALAKRMEKAMKSPEVLDMYNRLPAWVRKRGMPHISVYDNELSVYITLNDVASLKKDRRLNALLSAFADDVYIPYTDTYATSDHSAVGSYRFRRAVHTAPEGRFYIFVNITAYVKSDSPHCKVVVKGVKEVVTRQEVTEVVCS